MMSLTWLSLSLGEFETMFPFVWDSYQTPSNSPAFPDLSGSSLQPPFPGEQ